jgi:hypothetical protein
MRIRRSIITAVVLALTLATNLPAATRDTGSGLTRPDRPSVVTKARLALERVLRAFSGTPTVPIPEPPKP